MTASPIVIVAARRTPIGAFQGALSAVKATDLGAAALRGVLAESGVKPEEVSEVIMGCVLSAGLGQAPAAKRRWPPDSRKKCPAPPSTRCAAPA